MSILSKYPTGTLYSLVVSKRKILLLSIEELVSVAKNNCYILTYLYLDTLELHVSKGWYKKNISYFLQRRLSISDL
jgi:hypothetical protein